MKLAIILIAGTVGAVVASVFLLLFFAAGYMDDREIDKMSKKGEEEKDENEV